MRGPGRHQPADTQAVSRFWGGALGRELKFAADERYASLKGPHLDCFVQRVEPGHEGVHFDIETDNVDAEVARLEKLGARRKGQKSGSETGSSGDGGCR